MGFSKRKDGSVRTMVNRSMADQVGIYLCIGQNGVNVVV